MLLEDDNIARREKENNLKINKTDCISVEIKKTRCGCGLYLFYSQYV